MDVPTGLNYYRRAEAGLLDLVKQMLTYSINSPREGYRSSSRNVNRRVRCKYVQFYFQIISDRRTINVAPANALLISWLHRPVVCWFIGRDGKRKEELADYSQECVHYAMWDRLNQIV